MSINEIYTQIIFDYMKIVIKYKQNIKCLPLLYFRNEAWKFMPENCHIVLTPFRKAVFKNIFRDLIPAVALAFLTVQVVKKVWPDEHHHDDH
jgi:hypothetical protein